MAETFRVEIDGQTTTLEDSVPLESARLYKFVSDEVWQRKKTGSLLPFADVPVIRPPHAAFSATKQWARVLDSRFFTPIDGQDLKLGSRDDGEVSLSANELYRPNSAKLHTFYRDERTTGRIVQRDDQTVDAIFIDGHFDYDRDLSLSFGFENKQGHWGIDFLMQRMQIYQDQPTSLTLQAWNSSIADRGDEVSTLFHRELTENREASLLKLFAWLGDISLEAFAKA